MAVSASDYITYLLNCTERRVKQEISTPWMNSYALFFPFVLFRYVTLSSTRHHDQIELLKDIYFLMLINTIQLMRRGRDEVVFSEVLRIVNLGRK